MRWAAAMRMLAEQVLRRGYRWTRPSSATNQPVCIPAGKHCGIAPAVAIAVVPAGQIGAPGAMPIVHVLALPDSARGQEPWGDWLQCVSGRNPIADTESGPVLQIARWGANRTPSPLNFVVNGVPARWFRRNSGPLSHVRSTYS